MSFTELAGLARQLGREDDPVVRQGLAAAYTRLQLVRYLGLRVQTALSRGLPPGPESSVLKLAYSRHVAETGSLMMAIEGSVGMLSSGDAPDDGFWQQQFLGQWGVSIGGGTDQIQRNVIGERVLGLPGEPRTDKTMAFRELAGKS